jgi:hypothetical protein
VHRTKFVDIAGLLEELGNVPMVAKGLARELRGGTQPHPNNGFALKMNGKLPAAHCLDRNAKRASTEE